MSDSSVNRFSDVEKCLIFGNTHSKLHNEIILSGINDYSIRAIFYYIVIGFQIILYQMI